MEATTLTPTQQHLLKLFSFDNSEAYAREIQEVLTRHFQAKLDQESDRLWDPSKARPRVRSALG